MKNRIIEGDYKGKYIVIRNNDLVIPLSFLKTVYLNKETIQDYEIIDEDKYKSSGSAIIKAGVGAAFLGPIGLLAGMGAKNKGTYTIAISFKDEKKSLIILNDKAYKIFTRRMF